VSVAAPASRALGGRYWRLWSASTVSALGDGLHRVALPLLAVHLTRDPRQVALVAAAVTVPWLVFGLPIGALVDRWDRRRTIWVVDLLRTLAVAVLALAVAASTLSIGLLISVTFVLGTSGIATRTASPPATTRSMAGHCYGRLCRRTKPVLKVRTALPADERRLAALDRRTWSWDVLNRPNPNVAGILGHRRSA